MLKEPSVYTNGIFDRENISYVGNPELIMEKYLTEAKQGKPIEFIVTTCPDYSFEKDPINPQKTKYTFNSIGDNPGLVALGIMDNMLPIIEDLEREGAYNTLTFAYADNEAYDPDICSAMGIDQPSFLSKIETSAQKLFMELHHEYVRRGLNIYSVPSVLLMSEVMNLKIHGNCSTVAKELKNGTVDGIKLARFGLYSSWFENHPGLDKRNPVALDKFAKSRAYKDITDHLLLGESLREISKGINGLPSTSRNIVIVTMSDIKLARFLNYTGKYPHVPVIRVEKNY